MQSIKTPVKTITVPDWASLYESLSQGPLVIEDMSTHDVRAFNMWSRKHQGTNIKYGALFNGFMQVAIGGAVGKPGRKTKHDEVQE